MTLLLLSQLPSDLIVMDLNLFPADIKDFLFSGNNL